MKKKNLNVRNGGETMKKLFRIKIELIQLLVMIISTIIICSVNETYHNDYRIMLLSGAMVMGCVFSIIAYKPIQEFRKEVLRRW